jgi:uncharacterized protein YjbJ (UPF0337 family)
MPTRRVPVVFFDGGARFPYTGVHAWRACAADASPRDPIPTSRSPTRDHIARHDPAAHPRGARHEHERPERAHGGNPIPRNPRAAVHGRAAEPQRVTDQETRTDGARDTAACGARLAPPHHNRKDRTMNTQSDQVKGHVKSAAGIVTGNKDLQNKGDAETRTADAAAHIDDAKDKVEEVVDKTKDKVEEVVDKTKDALHRK